MPHEAYPTPIIRGRIIDKIAGELSHDAFSRVEVALPFTLGDYIHRYDLSPLLFDKTETGSGTVTHLPNESSVRLRCTSASGDVAAFQSRRYHRYQAGKALKAIVTCVPGAATANVRKRWGFFDANNGYFFELDGTTFSVVLRTSTSGSPSDTNKVARASFNGDKVDGTGASGFNLDFTKGNIFEIDAQWLGVGLVNFKVVNSLGESILLHQFRNANANTAVYMTTASLPIRFEQENTAGASQQDFIAVCGSVVSSGGEEPPELEFGFGNTTKITTSSGSETAVIAFRLASTFNSIANRQIVLPQDFYFASDLGSCLWRVYLNSTITGGSWVAVNANSCVEYNVTTASFTPGIPLLSRAVFTATPATATKNTQLIAGVRKLALTRNVANSDSDNILITVTRLTTTNVDAMASMEWGELR